MEEQEVKKTTRKSASAKKDEEIAELKDLIAQQQAMIEKLMRDRKSVVQGKSV